MKLEKKEKVIMKMQTNQYSCLPMDNGDRISKHNDHNPNSVLNVAVCVQHKMYKIVPM